MKMNKRKTLIRRVRTSLVSEGSMMRSGSRSV